MFMALDIHLKFDFKLIVGFFILLYFVIALLFFNFYKNLAVKDTQQEATSILHTINALREYIDNVQRPLIAELKESGRLDKDFFDPRLLSSSYITRQTYDILLANNNMNFSYKLAAINPKNINNKASPFEAKILNEFRSKTIDKYFAVQKEGNKDFFYIALPISSNQYSCLECHGDSEDRPEEMIKYYDDTNGSGEKLSDIRAMISLKIPVADIITYHLEQFIIGGLAMLFAFIMFIFFIYIIHKKDLKLQEKQEKLLLNQNKLASMGVMINNIAHQWRQPLTQLSAILVNIQLHADKDKLTKEKLTAKTQEANEQITFMSNTIDDFRNFFSEGKAIRDYQIEETIKYAKHLVCASLHAHQVELVIDIKDNYTLSGFPNEITQALINIINNAKDALVQREVENRRITIKTFIKDEKKYLVVDDNAGGIDKDIINKIFDPYFSTKHPSIGTGIGLCMSKVIIEKNNKGHICVENLEHGASFIITF